MLVEYTSSLAESGSSSNEEESSGWMPGGQKQGCSSCSRRRWCSNTFYNRWSIRYDGAAAAPKAASKYKSTGRNGVHLTTGSVQALCETLLLLLLRSMSRFTSSGELREPQLQGRSLRACKHAHAILRMWKHAEPHAHAQLCTRASMPMLILTLNPAHVETYRTPRPRPTFRACKHAHAHAQAELCACAGILMVVLTSISTLVQACPR